MKLINNIIYAIKDLRWQIPNIYSRARRGWGHADTWDFYIYLSKVISEGLKHYKSYHRGTPAGLTPKRWNAILDQIIAGFELIAKDTDISLLTKEERKKINRAFFLLSKYFFSLWD